MFFTLLLLLHSSRNRRAFIQDSQIRYPTHSLVSKPRTCTLLIWLQEQRTNPYLSFSNASFQFFINQKLKKKKIDTDFSWSESKAVGRRTTQHNKIFIIFRGIIYVGVMKIMLEDVHTISYRFLALSSYVEVLYICTYISRYLKCQKRQERKKDPTVPTGFFMKNPVS